MNITEFLEARISEDEAAANAVDLLSSEMETISTHYLPEFADYMLRWQPNSIRAECAAKRAIIAEHDKWPVLVESEPSELEQVAAGLNDFTYRMTRQIALLTTKEYIKRFGTEPPTAPIIAILAAVYKAHPDYDPEWIPNGG